MDQDNTQSPATRNIERNDLFLKFPQEYYQYALEWCSYPHWTIEESANLFTGCVPHRPMFLRGKQHITLDDEVLANENLIRASLHSELEIVKSQKYFGKTYIRSDQIFDWARNNAVLIPKDLLKAENAIRHQYQARLYTTPCLEAAKWVIENYWSTANLREPPTSGAIIHAMLQQFPELSGEECDWVEKVTRHPLTRHDR